jgi:hypothetical protein
MYRPLDWSDECCKRAITLIHPGGDAMLCTGRRKTVARTRIRRNAYGPYQDLRIINGRLTMKSPAIRRVPESCRLRAASRYPRARNTASIDTRDQGALRWRNAA